MAKRYFKEVTVTDCYNCDFVEHKLFSTHASCRMKQNRTLCAEPRWKIEPPDWCPLSSSESPFVFDVLLLKDGTPVIGAVTNDDDD